MVIFVNVLVFQNLLCTFNMTVTLCLSTRIHGFNIYRFIRIVCFSAVYEIVTTRFIRDSCQLSVLICLGENVHAAKYVFQLTSKFAVVI